VTYLTDAIEEMTKNCPFWSTLWIFESGHLDCSEIWNENRPISLTPTWLWAWCECVLHIVYSITGSNDLLAHHVATDDEVYAVVTRPGTFQRVVDLVPKH